MKLSLIVLRTLATALLVTPAVPLLPMPYAPFPVQAQTNQNRKSEADQLLEAGIQQYQAGKTTAALESFQRALVLFQQQGDGQGEGVTLNGIGLIYDRLGQYPKALEYYQQALAIRKEIGARQGEGVTLNGIGFIYKRLGQYPKALEYFQQSLAIRKEVGDREGEGITLNNIGIIYYSLSQYSKALEYFQQSLAIRKEVGDRQGEGTMLNNIGNIYKRLGQYPKALEYFQQSFAIGKEIGDREGEGVTLNSIGNIYDRLGQYPRALEFYQQSFAIRKEIGDREGEGTMLNNIGGIYDSLGQYPKALEYYQQSLAILKEVGDRQGEGTALNNIGFIYTRLGQYPKALEYYQQSLAILKEVGNREGEGTMLNNIGGIYYSLGQYPKALEYYQQALAILKEVGDREDEGFTLNNIGGIYYRLGQYPKALEYYQQALAIRKEIGDREGEGATLNNIGLINDSLGQYSKALEYYQQALAIAKEIGNRSGEGTTFDNIGGTYASRQQPAAAISFLKQAVSVYELIRQDNRPLPREQQEAYTKTVESTYRKLADLLLSQGRLLEAQQVLELLKIQEIDFIDREIRATVKPSGIEYTPTETEIKTQHGTLVALGEKLYTCENQQKTCDHNQLSQWQTQRQQVQEQFDQTLETAEAQAKNRLSQSAITGKEDFIKSYQSIVEAQPGTLLVYPFVTDDKIWLLWASAGGILGSTEVPTVGREKLFKAVKDFRDQLRSPNSDIQTLQQSSQQLYQWLIKPLEPALEAKQIQHLVFSLDSTTRYIPMGALFDGKQYLIQRYTVSTVLNASLTVMDDRLPRSPQATPVLALGVSKDFPNFPALTSVPEELKTIMQVYPGNTFLNQDFNEQTLTDHLTGQKIIHIATHANFQAANPKNSFLLLGNGHEYLIRQIQFLRNLGKVHLVVLSACETALSETDPSGKEILGISAYFTGGTSKARAVLASLWQVNDSSTSRLMQQFYKNLSTGTMTKAEALQQAQVTMITGDTQNSASGQPRSSVNYNPGQNQTATLSRGPSHPYYWAPFILIGNGL